MVSTPKLVRYVRFENGILFLKAIRDGKRTEEELGSVITRKGHLTHREKLAAVNAAGEWVKI